MLPIRSGTFRIFRLFGINVHLHWLWLVLLVIRVQAGGEYRSRIWNLYEFLALFAIVLLHEYGHALACRSVGGQARDIVLWPLGGVAFVSPPRRPGPVLWSIAAGPLVNVLLFPVTLVLLALAGAAGQGGATGAAAVTPDFAHFLFVLFVINTGLLVFNLLPIYPLDGGQMLMALLWFVIGQARALRATAVIGLIAAVVGGAVCLLYQNWWLVIMAAFVGMQAFRGYQAAQQLARIEAQEARGRGMAG